MVAAVIGLLSILAAPPASEATLNDLLVDIIALQAKGVVAISDPIDESTRRHLNLRPEKSPDANPALFRVDQLEWVPCLVKLEPTEPTADARRRIVKFLNRGKAEAKAGFVNAATFAELTSAIRELDEWLTKRIADVPGAEYSAAKRQMKLLQGAAETLKLGDAKEYLAGGANVAASDDVAALAYAMRTQKLRFAAAAPGGEKAYEGLKPKLEKYLTALRVAAPPP